MNFTFFKTIDKKHSKNFFDYSSAEKKKIVKEATIGANRLQSELVNKYRTLTG